MSIHENVDLLVVREIDSVCGYHRDRSRANAPTGGRIPVGGGDWMDEFFKQEALEGTLSALRKGLPIDKAIACGRRDCQYAINLWNDRNKKNIWVHRCDGWIQDFIVTVVRQCIAKVGSSMILVVPPEKDEPVLIEPFNDKWFE